MVAGSIGVVAGAGVVVVAPPAPPAPPAPAPASESDGTVVAAANAAADAVVPVAAENVNVFLSNTNSILTHCIIKVGYLGVMLGLHSTSHQSSQIPFPAELSAA